jgi:hypothetical protein
MQKTMQKTRRRQGTEPAKLKNGFYIEVCNPGFKKGIKIARESRQAMEILAKQYAKYKEVIILGEFRNGVPLVVRVPAANTDV